MKKEVNFRDNHFQNTIFNYEGKKIPKILGQAPFRPVVFLGREEELKTIREEFSDKADQGNVLLLVNGEGGIGKTSLASQYYHTYFKEYMHLAWVYTEDSISDALLTLAAPLEVALEGVQSKEEKLERVVEHLNILSGPSLVIIDNANRLDDLRDYQKLLGSFPDLHILVTTRVTQLKEARSYRIGHLKENNAIKLFKSFYEAHEEAEDELLPKILASVGYNTLVIEILAKNLSNFNNVLEKGYHLKDLLQDLQNNGVLALRQTDSIRTNYQSQEKKYSFRQATPEEIITAMYDISPLDEMEKQLLSIFAVLPAETIDYKHLKELLPSIEELGKRLISLSQIGWIEFNKELKYFRCSPVVQEIVRLQNAETLTEHCQELSDSIQKAIAKNTNHNFFSGKDYDKIVLFAEYGKSILRHLPNLNFQHTYLCYNLGVLFQAIGDLIAAFEFYNLLDLLDSENQYIVLKIS